ncbi:uncharacterized protein LOC128892162 [Hylaeus anthracinus]|uniref:uncharacterized protein LOC128881187 n=1 Tax=Hylaeus volcanicus TaxID=313075 RepID=UPI0023B7FF27|nr:uncharacterized protein LOC128881187 [Hylaeus volcanicus]XP_054008308.1 uncharacterized protein LOC128892162 [Hylaeus anthracinus]
MNETRSDHQDYFEKKHISDTFRFLIGHLVVNQPEDPIQFLYQLIDDCILFRSGLKEPRLFWMKRHVDSIFQSFDSSSSGHLSLDTYKTAMQTLGIRSYNPCPVECLPGFVDQQTFRKEALYSLETELAHIFGKNAY